MYSTYRVLLTYTAKANLINGILENYKLLKHAVSLSKSFDKVMLRPRLYAGEQRVPLYECVRIVFTILFLEEIIFHIKS